MDEKKIEGLYLSVLNQIEKKMGKRGTTYMDELLKMGRSMFPNNFKGVYSADEIPDIQEGDYVIANLDKHNQAGSHWIGITRIGNRYYYYDSFGRRINKIMPGLSGRGKVIGDTKDKEQRVDETNCGQRCLSWLWILHNYGIKEALLI